MTLAPALSTATAQVDEVLDFLADRPLVVLTGAGCSTDSGIPDYRGPGSPARTPMTYQEFVSGPRGAAALLGAQPPRLGPDEGAEPNAGHLALARIDPELLITQNVDGLHERAGSRRLVALHGRIADVVCLGCRAVRRHGARCTSGSPSSTPASPSGTGGRRCDPTATSTSTRPTTSWWPAAASAAACSSRTWSSSARTCRSTGSSAATPRSTRWPSDDGALLVAGSSLTVMSGFRFVRRAAKAGTPVVIVNRGATRGDDLATYRLDAGTTEFLTALDARRSS